MVEAGGYEKLSEVLITKEPNRFNGPFSWEDQYKWTGLCKSGSA